MRYLRFGLVKLWWLNVSLLATLLFKLTTPYIYDEYGIINSLFVIYAYALVLMVIYVAVISEVDQYVYRRWGRRLLMTGEFD